MDGLENSFPEILGDHSLTFDMENLGNEKDSLMDILNIPDMLYQGFDHLSNLPLENDDIELGSITEDFDYGGTLSLPDMEECKVKIEEECKIVKTPLKMVSEDAFVTLKKLWPNQDEILKEKKCNSKNVASTSKQLFGRKNVSVINNKRPSTKKDLKNRTVRVKKIEDESNEEIDIETIDDELNEKSGAEILSMKINNELPSDGVTVKPEEIIPKNRSDNLELISKALQEKPKNSDTSNVKCFTELEPKAAALVPSVSTNDSSTLEITSNSKAATPEISAEKLSQMKRRESLLRILPKGAIIKPKSKDSHPASVVEKIRQSTQQPRTSILIPCLDNPLNKLGRNGKSSNVKPSTTPIVGLPVPLPPLSTSIKPLKNNTASTFLPTLMKLIGPTSSQSSDAEEIKKEPSSIENSHKETPSLVITTNAPIKVFEKSILKPIVLKKESVSKATIKMEPSSLASTPVSSDTNSNSATELLIQPLVSVLTNQLKKEFLNNDKITSKCLSQPLFMELKRLIPDIFQASFDHNYCTNKDKSQVEEKPDDNALVLHQQHKAKNAAGIGDESVVMIKSEKASTLIDKKVAGSANEIAVIPVKTQSNMVKKETGRIASPWHQDVLLNQLRSMKRNRRDSSSSVSSQYSKRHRSSCSPSTSTSSQSVYCYSPSPPHSPRNSGKLIKRNGNRRNTGRCRHNSRSYSRDSSSRSRSPGSRRKSYSRSPSRSWSRTKKSRMRSRSKSFSRSRSPSQSWSRSKDTYTNSRNSANKKDRKRFNSPVWSNNSYKSTQAEKDRQIEEKRVLFVGNISNNATKKDLYDRFCEFGRIIELSVHFREVRENYGFVTFAYSSDAQNALEHGNDEPKFPRLDLRYGVGRQYNKPRYRDFDLQVTTDDLQPKLDFDSLMRVTKAQLYGKKHC